MAKKPDLITEGLDTAFSQMKRKADREKRPIISLYTPQNNFEEQLKRRIQARLRYGATTETVFETFHSPFRLRTTIERPSQRKELIDWYRYYFKYHYLVGTACELHAEFPLSNFTLDVESQDEQDFFNEVAEELDLFNFILNMALEYFCVGEAFPFGFFDNPENPQMWTQFILLNPKNVRINTHPLVTGRKEKQNYTVNLIPDDDLRKIVDNGPIDETTGPLFQNLPADIIEKVRQRQDIPLNPLQVSHFKRMGSYFSVRGESIISRVLDLLMYEDKLRDAQYCQKGDVDVLTDRGFIKLKDIALSDKVATFNRETEAIEFHYPKQTVSFDHDDELYTFRNRKIDFTCTPNHRTLVKLNTGKWTVKEARDVVYTNFFRTNGESWSEGKDPPPFVFVGEKKIAIKDYLEFAGYYLAEGWSVYSKKYHQYLAGISQKIETKTRAKMQKCINCLPFPHSKVEKASSMAVYGKQISKHMSCNFGKNSKNKKIPRWIKSLKPEYLEILLEAACLGDATIKRCKDRTLRVSYATISKQLADDIQEIAWKCGYNPTMGDWQMKSGNTIYMVYWSKEKKRGRVVRIDSKENINIEHYKGKVYCLVVPNGFFVTRQNGRMVIHGNSILDRHVSPHEFYMIGEPENPADQTEIDNFQQLLASMWTNPNQAIVYHHALRIQWEGAGGRILAAGPEYELLERHILSGLMLSKAFLHGEGPCADPETEVLTENGFKKYWEVKDDERLATFDKETGKLEYDYFLNRIVRDFDGEMIHAQGQKIDFCMTPNHRMWVCDRSFRTHQIKQANWKIIPAENLNTRHRLRACIDDYDGIEPTGDIYIGGKKIPLELFVEFLGYYLSEGWTTYKPPCYQVRISQSTKSPYFEKMKTCVEKLPFKMNLHKKKEPGQREFIFCNKVFATFIHRHFPGKSREKFIPKEYKNLPPKYLRILIEALMAGDGSSDKYEDGPNYRYYQYHTSSKQLAEDVYEIAFKLGYSPTMAGRSSSIAGSGGIYRIRFSDSSVGKFPLLQRLKIERVPYKGKVWCFEMPKEFLIMRRNHKVFVTGNTYANSSIALDVLISRYLVFRQKMERWIREAVFRPLCQIHGIYKETKKSSKYYRWTKKIPLLPTVNWNKTNLRDDMQKLTLYQRLVQDGLIPISMLLKAANIDPKEARTKLEEERKEGWTPKGLKGGLGGLGGLPAALPGALGRPTGPLPTGYSPTEGPSRRIPKESERPVGTPGGIV